MTAQPAIAPVQQTERVQIVDILRGFALFGILFVNMTIFSRPFQSILLPADRCTISQPAGSFFRQLDSQLVRFHSS